LETKALRHKVFWSAHVETVCWQPTVSLDVCTKPKHVKHRQTLETDSVNIKKTQNYSMAFPPNERDGSGFAMQTWQQKRYLDEFWHNDDEDNAESDYLPYLLV